MIHHRRPAVQCTAQQCQQHPRRIDGGIVGIDAAAVVEVAVDFGMLIGPGHDADPLFEPGRLVLRLACHGREVTRRVRTEEASIRAPTAVHFPGGERAQIRHSIEPFPANSESNVRAEFFLQRLE